MLKSKISNWYKKSLFKKKLFGFGCAGSSLLGRLFSSCGKQGSSLVAMHRLFIAVASLFMKHGSTASVVSAHGLSSCHSWALEHRLNSCGKQASCSDTCVIFTNWIKPVSPALAGGFFTIEPPGKPSEISFYIAHIRICQCSLFIQRQNVVIHWKSTKNWEKRSPLKKNPLGTDLVTATVKTKQTKTDCKAHHIHLNNIWK